RGLAEAGRTDKQHMVQRLVTLARGFDEDREILACLRLADELGQQLRAQRGVADIVGTALGRNDAGGRVHSLPRLYLLGRSSPMLATFGVRPLSGTMTRALAS